uniref:ADP-ribosylhydrolase ARH3 n=1 Tax=Panagrellus redivivus TaxID=6233 RepID=A0A7E4V892_PANRE
MLQTAFDTAVRTARTDIVRDHLNDAQHQAHPQPDTEASSSSTSELPIDYLGITLQIAFYELLYANSFSNGVIDAISYGGDTTNNAAITGALLGARFGVDGIPDQWRTTVEHARLDRQKVFPDVCLADADALVKRLLYKLSL